MATRRRFTGAIDFSMAKHVVAAAADIAPGERKLVEVDALRTQPLRVGQLVGVKPEQYRLFAGHS